MDGEKKDKKVGRRQIGEATPDQKGRKYPWRTLRDGKGLLSKREIKPPPVPF